MRRHLTYANVGVTICLFVLLGGGAYAAVKLGKNSVKSKQIKDGQVKTQDIADGGVGSEDIADGSIGAGKLGGDVFSGINAAKVGGLEVKKVNFQAPVGTATRTILSFPGAYRIDARCQSVGDVLDVEAVSEVNGARITEAAEAISGGSSEVRKTTSADPFNATPPFPIDINVGSTSYDATVHFSTPAGFVSTVFLSFERTVPNCKLTGFAVGG